MYKSIVVLMLSFLASPQGLGQVASDSISRKDIPKALERAGVLQTTEFTAQKIKRILLQVQNAKKHIAEAKTGRGSAIRSRADRDRILRQLDVFAEMLPAISKQRVYSRPVPTTVGNAQLKVGQIIVFDRNDNTYNLEIEGARAWVFERLQDGRNKTFRVEFTDKQDRDQTWLVTSVFRDPDGDNSHDVYSLASVDGLIEALDQMIPKDAQKWSAPEVIRTWTADSGHKTQAAIKSIGRQDVLLLKKDGKAIEVPQSRLSVEDRRYLDAWEACLNTLKDDEIGLNLNNLENFLWRYDPRRKPSHYGEEAFMGDLTPRSGMGGNGYGGDY